MPRKKPRAKPPANRRPIVLRLGANKFAVASWRGDENGEPVYEIAHGDIPDLTVAARLARQIVGSARESSKRGRPKLFEDLSGEDDPKLERCRDDVDMRKQYNEITELLRQEGVDWRKSEDRNEWRVRSSPRIRAAWERSSLSWKLVFSGDSTDVSPTSSTDESPPTLDGLHNIPIMTEPVLLPEQRLQVIMRKATSRLEAPARRGSVRSRLAYQILAEHWGFSPDAIRGRVERMQKREPP